MHDDRFAIILLWLLGFEVPLDKVRSAIISTRGLFVSFAHFRSEMLKQLGASYSRDDEADWISQLAVQLADGRPDRAEDLEGIFHLFIGSRPNFNIICRMIQRSTKEQSVRAPSKKEILSMLTFLRKNIPLHSVIDSASAKSDNEWLVARQEWLRILCSLRRLSSVLDLNQKEFRLEGYQLIILFGPLVFLTLLFLQDPQKKHWIIIFDKATRDLKSTLQNNPKLSDPIKAFFLRRAKHLAHQDKLRRLKLRT
ncbi:hypothetical protein [Sulfobacillus thermosulfidooxidans]|uniref:hypothetical protein n=1 Tax=Sulfobacillus thermosulfidooxidans TaxID=28034 RepID=UPI0012FD0387|nr:hypothetical protein [Sulfobacillus thermosulfidooxidans]